LIKDTSVAKRLHLRFYNLQRGKKLTIKLGIDTNPPTGSTFEHTNLSCCVGYEVCHQDLIGPSPKAMRTGAVGVPVMPKTGWRLNAEKHPLVGIAW
jgi:hypothetical protein